MLAHLIVGLFNVLLGIGIIIGSISLGIAWLGICFGTVILGVALLLLAPHVLLLPFSFIPFGVGFVWIGFGLLGKALEEERAVTLRPKVYTRVLPNATDDKITKIVQQRSTPESERANMRFDETAKFDFDHESRGKESHKSSPTLNANKANDLAAQALQRREALKAKKTNEANEAIDANDLVAQALQRIEDMVCVAKQDVARHISRKASTKRWVFNMKHRCLIDTQFNKTYSPGEFLHVSGATAGFKVQAGGQVWVSDADVSYKDSWVVD